ncbi:MAG TPA: biopolymer transporter ExbD [Flavobacterium sp.]|nr:biopolymer transporter ExbD [Flavobacterium sp.]
MRLRRNKRFQTEVATTALNDIMFFLLLFFLIISTLANPNVIKLALPKSEANDTTNKQHISLSVTEDKRYYIDKNEVNFEDIEEQLRLQVDPNLQTVVIRIPYDLQVQDLVDLLQIGVKLNVKFVIATDKN